MPGIESYRELIGDEAYLRITRKAQALKGKSLLHLNATYLGGGVAEMLASLVPLLTSLGVATDWRVLRGSPEFFEVTKRIHNGLQGERIALTEEEKELYLRTNKEYVDMNHIHHDLVVIHDPQPLPLITCYERVQPWAWRCHIDLSDPDKELWQFLEPFVSNYDKTIVTGEIYERKGLSGCKHIRPAIDPLSHKNRPMSVEEQTDALGHYRIPTDKKILSQVSRFDKWKDPQGAIEVFKRVRERVDCRLVLAGNLANDDPEGTRIYEELVRANRELVESGDLMLALVCEHNDAFINALQRASSVVIQKSTKEGFGLVVTEAMWKGTPVVASGIGGIPYQIEDGVSGHLCDPQDLDGFARRIGELLEDDALRERIARAARERVRERFLITRLAEDYLDLMEELLRSTPLARVPERNERESAE